MSDGDWMGTELRRLEEQGLERRLQVYARAADAPSAGGRLDFSSNDYLGLARAPEVLAAAEQALRDWGAGSGASRLVSGTLPCHAELEDKLAVHKGYQAALVFGSGYLANLGLLGALAGRDDCILADKLAHASLLDGAVLSRAKVLRFRHNDPEHLRDMLSGVTGARRIFVVTESVFSMDGDLAPLGALAEAARAANAMFIVDEAHATGVFGPRGSGLIGALNLRDCVPVAMGTLSKALGGYGGFVAGSNVFKRWLINRARAFIFSTSLPPASVGAALGALAALDRQPCLGALLLERARSLRERLRAAGFNTGNSASQIIPLIIGDNHQTLRFAQRLRERGVLAVAIRPPTVPEGTARLRLSLTLRHTPDDVERAAEIMITTAREERIL